VANCSISVTKLGGVVVDSKNKEFRTIEGYEKMSIGKLTIIKE
jgi:hypothetical protein